MTLEEAVAAAKARARGNCRACQTEEQSNREGRYIEFRPKHTCHGDLAAVKDAMLAAAREARDTGLPHTEAEIERQFGLPEGSEGGRRRMNLDAIRRQMAEEMRGFIEEGYKKHRIPVRAIVVDKLLELVNNWDTDKEGTAMAQGNEARLG